MVLESIMVVPQFEFEGQDLSSGQIKYSKERTLSSVVLPQFTWMGKMRMPFGVNCTDTLKTFSTGTNKNKKLLVLWDLRHNILRSEMKLWL